MGFLSRKTIGVWAAAGIGVLVGAVLMAIVIVRVMPGMMLVVEPSKMGFEETVTEIETQVEAAGWSLVASKRMNNSLAQHGVEFDPRIQILQICKASYAEKVLTSDRYVAALMPCTIAVYENDAGDVMISKMNTGLMGKLFGGTIAEVMGGDVARDEARMLATVVH